MLQHQRIAFDPLVFAFPNSNFVDCLKCVKLGVRVSLTILIKEDLSFVPFEFVYLVRLPDVVEQIVNEKQEHYLSNNVSESNVVFEKSFFCFCYILNVGYISKKVDEC